MRIAVTTTSGLKVDQHFGKARSFSIYDVKADEVKLIETRLVDSYCQSSAEETPDKNHQFSENRLSMVYERIKDCDKVYTLQIGEKPEAAMKNKGIKVQACSCNIEKIPGCSGKCK
ncbi:NifB/NifX family molybdenum-iron cluster-binding protein [uncultured Draconibacterium sp.]|uniref:NifB/NifX family molybdenum-iron cluster-binding protein n=1 Tax=uncultured Draconibacterium sp. TaxID=1573823 RepID=UPI0025FCDECF|nr:NifB/NifX family molybdenum-iron cluster-binding protein [uncultured Draconibacterium sp.]